MVPFSNVRRPGLKTGPASVAMGVAAPADRRRPLEASYRLRSVGPVHDREGYRPMVESSAAQSSTPSGTSANDQAHWKKTTNLMLIHLGIWLFFGYVIHMFVVPLNKIVIPILGFPLGFYMAAQGSLIVFVVMLFVFARQQNKIDRKHGYAEDE